MFEEWFVATGCFFEPNLFNPDIHSVQLTVQLQENFRIASNVVQDDCCLRLLTGPSLENSTPEAILPKSCLRMLKPAE